MRIADKYHSKFNPDNINGNLKKGLFCIMLSMPHIITVLIMIMIWPNKWIGILIVGLVLPDFSISFHTFIHPAAIFRKNKGLMEDGMKRKDVAHLMTIVVVLIMFVLKENVIAMAGAIHLILDYVGF
jgi:hypothetical protein